MSIPGQPSQIFLFSGHMIDRADRAQPRFPASKEPIAAQAIREKLDGRKAAAGDLGICGGACGGDILFAEACLERGLHVQLHLQFPEPEFLEASVSFAGPAWEERYLALKRHPACRVLVQTDELGPLPPGMDPYERNNLWQLETALSHGPGKVTFLCLWNGQAGDGPGGTKQMMQIVEQNSGRSCVLKTTDLW